jgi:7-dehydrocholesterol reductase
MSKASQRVPNWIHKLLIPILLLVLCPPMVFLIWYINTALEGSFMALWNLITTDGFFPTLWMIISPVMLGSATAWKMLGIFAVFQLALMRIIPGRTFRGPITPKGNVPVYLANGPLCFLITMATFFITSYGYNLFSPTIIYDQLGYLFGALNISSLVLCLFLYFKGIKHPSTSDHGSSGHAVFDFYWGTELYPRVCGWDIKQFTNCRMGMMSWGLFLISYAAKQQELYGLSDSMIVSISLQLIYIAKFFIWETGYFRSLDIMHDRAGFMICWGCLVWVPCVYTSASMYLVHNPIILGYPLAILFFTLGIAGIAINYIADKQRQDARATNGRCTIWGKKAEIIEASYKTQTGEEKKTILLTSGFWGVSRHFHYLPELLAALMWSIPALFTSFMPYFYFIFLAILLVDRSVRHENICAKKYGSAWTTYRKKVPYKIIPYIY